MKKTSIPTDLVAYRVDAKGPADEGDLVLFVWGGEEAPSTPQSTTPAATTETSPKLRTSPLSPAEADVLALVVRGESNAAIAKVRGRSMRTVANQVASLLRKLGAESRFELMSRFQNKV